jgi:hypothetical protein
MWRWAILPLDTIGYSSEEGWYGAKSMQHDHTLLGGQSFPSNHSSSSQAASLTANSHSCADSDSDSLDQQENKKKSQTYRAPSHYLHGAVCGSPGGNWRKSSRIFAHLPLSSLTAIIPSRLKSKMPLGIQVSIIIPRSIIRLYTRVVVRLAMMRCTDPSNND